jgi:hypothetical protein
MENKWVSGYFVFGFLILRKYKAAAMLMAAIPAATMATIYGHDGCLEAALVL